MIDSSTIPDTIDATGGGGNPIPPPKGYMPTTPQQRSDWNGFIDNLSKQGNINLNDPQVAQNFLNQYKQNNPNFSITPEMIPNIQYEQNQVRTGDSFGSLNADQLKAARQGMSPNFLNQTNVYQQRYPQFKVGGQDFGTDIEGYSKFKAGGGATNPPPATNAAPIPTVGKGSIPLPDYSDPASRQKYAQNIDKQYGPLMEGRGDTFLRMNEIPQGGTDTAKNLSIKAFGKLGIDPALGYASAMEEGMSGEFKNKDGTWEKENSGNKDFPVTGSAAYGLDTFVSKFPDLVKKGYLPASFKDQFIPYHPSDKNVTQDSALYKTADAALQAKAAFLKSNYDEVDDYVKKNNITISSKARDFFALANYNGGKGVGLEMIKDYNKNGYLKNDKFMDARPIQGEGLKSTSYGPTYDDKGNKTGDGVYTNVIRRIKMADALKEQKLM